MNEIQEDELTAFLKLLERTRSEGLLAYIREEFNVELGNRGRLTIPSEIREEYDMEEGDILTMGLMSVEGETLKKRHYRSRDKMLREKMDQILKEESIKHDDEEKARSKAFNRLQDEYLTDDT